MSTFVFLMIVLAGLLFIQYPATTIVVLTAGVMFRVAGSLLWREPSDVDRIKSRYVRGELSDLEFENLLEEAMDQRDSDQ